MVRSLPKFSEPDHKDSEGHRGESHHAVPSVLAARPLEPALHWAAACTGGGCVLNLAQRSLICWGIVIPTENLLYQLYSPSSGPQAAQLSQAAQKQQGQSLLCCVRGVSLKCPKNCANLFHAFLILDSLETATERLSQELCIWWHQDRIQKAVAVLCGFLSLWHPPFFILIMTIGLCKKKKNWELGSRSLLQWRQVFLHDI